MMLAFETRCRQFQLGVQGYCSLQKEDQRPPLLNLKIKGRRKPMFKDMQETNPLCVMKDKLRFVQNCIQQKVWKSLCEALIKEESGQAQLKQMKKFLQILKDHLKNWEKSFCKKCGLIFQQHEQVIKFFVQQMDRLFHNQVEFKKLATIFDNTISHLKLAITKFSSKNQCIKKRAKTKDRAYRRKKSSKNSKKKQQIKREDIEEQEREIIEEQEQQIREDIKEQEQQIKRKIIKKQEKIKRGE